MHFSATAFHCIKLHCMHCSVLHYSALYSYALQFSALSWTANFHHLTLTPFHPLISLPPTLFLGNPTVLGWSRIQQRTNQFGKQEIVWEPVKSTFGLHFRDKLRDRERSCSWTKPTLYHQICPSSFSYSLSIPLPLQ